MNGYDLAHYEKALTEWKRDKKTAEPAPELPEEPTAERCLVTDTTVEALAPILLANPSGLLLARDELNGWLESFDRYSGGKGGDASHWLSMHGGESILVDRKTGVPRTIHVSTPELTERVKAHKPALLEMLTASGSPELENLKQKNEPTLGGLDADPWDSAIDAGELDPCPKCGSLELWESMLGN